MVRTKSIDKFAKAFRAAQAAMEPVKRNASNVDLGTTYADQLAVHEAIRAALLEHGITYHQDVERIDGQWWAVVTLAHESGQERSFRNPITAEPRQGAHKWESASTYAHRVCLARACGLPIGKDDDGNLATGRQPNQRAAQQGPRPRALSAEEIQRHADDLRAAFRDCASQADLEEVARQAGRHWGKEHPVVKAVADDYRRRMQDLQAEAAAA